MTRTFSSCRVLQRLRALGVTLLLFGAACGEDGTLYGVNGAAARLSIAASASAIGETVVVDIAYQRVAGANVPMSTQSLTVTSTSNQQLTIPIDLTSCLLDASRVIPRENACSIVAAVTLRSTAGATLDSSVVGPVAVSVGGVENLPATTLRAIGTVSVATAASLFIGETGAAVAVVRDREGATISGRPVTWSSSSPIVFVVNATTGSLTGVSAGTATITARSQGITGSATVTVLPRLAVLSVTPASGSTNVPIESTVRVTFSDNLDPVSVTPATVRLTQGGFDVAATRLVSTNSVVITPTAPLTEFNTAYTLTVSPGVRSVTGNSTAINATSSFTSVFWDPSYTYRVINDLRGPGESLDILATGTNCFMVATSNASSQFWYFVPIGSTVFSTMANVVSGDTKALEGSIAPTRCFMHTPPGTFSGTFWRAVSAAPFAAGRYYLQNGNFGAARSLDISPDSAGLFAPRMLPTGNVTGQLWSFVRLGRL